MRNNPIAPRGFTLLELLCAIAVMTTLTMIAATQWRPLIDTIEASAVHSHIARAFADARMTAVYKKSLTTVCPLNENRECINNWNSDISVFVDPTNQKKVLSDDQIQYVYRLSENGHLLSSYAGSQRRRYFQFKPDGGVNGSIGHLIWCPASGNEKKASQVRINFGGRLHWAVDNDKDGIAENTSGQPISCS